jgi:folate-binding protein YgfZ
MQPGASALAGLHNPQGRVVAVLHMNQTSADSYALCLPAELTEAVIARLRRFVLRARVTLAPDTTIAMPLALATAAARIAAGIPMICAATSEHFVAQMLNLDALGAISFSKGCYTGQEIIARAHYRGRVKRRMQRFRTQLAVCPAPGAQLTLADGRSAEVIEAVRIGDHEQELLAVTIQATGVSSAESLPLPYSV